MFDFWSDCCRRRYVNHLQVLLLWVLVLPGLAVARDDALFWKVESKTATVYLFGSIHIGSPDLYPLPEPVEQAFAASDHLVLEIDLTRIDQSEVALLTQRLGLLADGNTLRTLLPADIHAAAAAAHLFGEQGIAALLRQRGHRTVPQFRE